MFKISDAEKKKKNDDEYTWTDGWKTKFFSVFHFFPFFVEKVQPAAEKRESLFEQNENIFFNFHVREKKKKWGKSISNRQRKRSTALQRLQ